MHWKKSIRDLQERNIYHLCHLYLSEVQNCWLCRVCVESSSQCRSLCREAAGKLTRLWNTAKADSIREPSEPTAVREECEIMNWRYNVWCEYEMLHKCRQTPWAHGESASCVLELFLALEFINTRDVCLSVTLSSCQVPATSDFFSFSVFPVGENMREKSLLRSDYDLCCFP